MCFDNHGFKIYDTTRLAIRPKLFPAKKMQAEFHNVNFKDMGSDLTNTEKIFKKTFADLCKTLEEKYIKRSSYHLRSYRLLEQ